MSRARRVWTSSAEAAQGLGTGAARDETRLGGNAAPSPARTSEAERFARATEKTPKAESAMTPRASPVHKR